MMPRLCIVSLLRSRRQDDTECAKVLEQMPVGAWESQEGRDCQEARLTLGEGRGGRLGKRSDSVPSKESSTWCGGPGPATVLVVGGLRGGPVAPKLGESAWHPAGTLLQFALLSVLLESSLILSWLQLVNFLKPYFPLLNFFFLILTEASIIVLT